MICINYHTLERLVCWTSVNGKLLKPHICFHHKKLLGKRFVERNNKCCKVFNTHKNGRVSHSPIRKNKNWIYCLKAIKSEKFQDPPSPFCVGVINGSPLNSSWLWRANIWSNDHIHLLNTLIFCRKMENHRTSIHEKLSHVFLKINEYQK